MLETSSSRIFIAQWTGIHILTRHQASHNSVFVKYFIFRIIDVRHFSKFQLLQRQ